MSFPNTTTAPSPMKDQMGSLLHDGGSTFRAWSPFAGAVAVRVWDGTAEGEDVPLARDSSAGYGDDCWSAFVPRVAEGSHYRFVVTTPGGARLERVDPFGRSVVYPNWTPATRDDSDARSVVAARDFDWGPPFQAPGWRELVIYQLHVGTFHDPALGGANRIDDLIAQLGHLRRLGVNAVQLLPFTEFGSAISLGYNSVLPYAIERDYGRPQDFKRLVRAMHEAGMLVLADVVFNHIVVSDHDGQVFPYSLFAWDGWSPAGNPCGAFFYGGDEMNTPWGPRPDYGREAVRSYLRDNALMWLEEYRLDGLRHDSTKCVRRRQGPCGDQCCGSDLGSDRNFGWELLQTVNDAIKARQPWKLAIAEDLDGNPAITAPTSAGGAGFDAQWDTELTDALRAAITRPTDDAISVEQVAGALAGSNRGIDPFERIIYLESHDQAQHGRVPDLVFPGEAEGWHARKKSMLGAAVVLTAPGIPMLFQGCEILDWRRWNDGVSIDWSRSHRFPKLFQFYADLVRLRTNAGGRTRGLCGAGLHVIQANAATKVVAYHRWDQGSGVDDVVVVANFSGTAHATYTIGLPYAGMWYVRLNSDANAYSDVGDFGAVHSYDTSAESGAWDGMPFSGNVGVGPYSMIVLSR